MRQRPGDMSVSKIYFAKKEGVLHHTDVAPCMYGVQESLIEFFIIFMTGGLLLVLVVSLAYLTPFILLLTPFNLLVSSFSVE